MKRFFPFLFMVGIALLAGCQSSETARANSQPRPSFPNQTNWFARREAELTQMGLTKDEARTKAQEEWDHLGNTTETYSLYDSTAKQKAKQDKFENDLAKTQKGN